MLSSFVLSRYKICELSGFATERLLRLFLNVVVPAFTLVGVAPSLLDTRAQAFTPGADGPFSDMHFHRDSTWDVNFKIRRIT